MIHEPKTLTKALDIVLTEVKKTQIKVFRWHWYACTFGNKLPFEEHNFKKCQKILKKLVG